MSVSPSRWADVSLGEVCEFKYGKSLPEAARAGGVVPVFGSNGVVGEHDAAITSGPTIIIGRKGSFGEVNFCPSKCWPIDTTYYVDNTTTNADLRWLVHRLASLGLNKLNKAAAVPGLNREDAYRQRLLLPPLKEQRRIAAILDKADALRVQRRAALAQLDTLTQSIFLYMFGDPATNPKGWPIHVIGDYVREFQGGKSIESESGENVVTRNRVLKVSAVTGMKFLAHESKPMPDSYEPPTEHFAKPGDLLFSRANTTELVGAVAYVDSTPPNLLLPDKLWRFVWRDPSSIEPLFIWALFQTPHLRREIGRRATGTSGSMKNISQEKVFGIRTILPDVSSQREFARRIRLVEKVKATQHASLADLDAFFASLQHRAFRGEL